MFKLLCFLLLCLTGTMVLAQQQVVTPQPANLTTLSGAAVSFDVSYNTSNNSPTTGLSLRMHFDSSRLSFTNLANPLEMNLLPNLPVVEDDINDLDGDPDTDRFVLMVWVDTGSGWPGVIPESLYTAHFSVSAGFVSTTRIRFSAETANGYIFDAMPVQIDPLGPGITVTPLTGLTTTESGGSDTFSVVLESPPTGDVIVALSSSDVGEGLASPTTMIFTPANWNQARVVTVTGVDDQDTDGDVAYQIRFAPAASTDPGYSGLDPSDVSVINLDDETLTSLVLDIPGNLTAGPGSNLTVPIHASNVGPGIISFDLTVTYDPALLTYAGLATSGNLAASWQVLANPTVAGTLRIGGISTQPLAGDGTLLGVNFSINPLAVNGDCSTLNLTDLLLNDGETPVTGDDGQLCVTTCVKGDVNGNDLVTLHDASLVLHAAVGLPTPHDPIPLYCADADCDNNLLALDAALLQRFALELDPELCPAGRVEDGSGGSVVVSTPNRALVTGQAFEIPVQISPVTPELGVISYQFTLTFDPALIQIEGFDLSDTLSQDWLAAINPNTPGQVSFGAINVSPLQGEGVLVRLTGTATQNVGNTDLIWDNFIFSSGAPQAGAVNAFVQVEQNIAPEATSLHILCEQNNSSGPELPEVMDPNANDHFVFQLLSQPQNGQAVLEEDGFIYTPQIGFLGFDSFSFLITDSGGLSLLGTASVIVEPTVFFELMASWPSPDLIPLVELIDDPAGVPTKRPKIPVGQVSSYKPGDEMEATGEATELELLALVQRAQAFQIEGLYREAERLYLQLTKDDGSWFSWAAQSALVAQYRRTGESEKAYALTNATSNRQPDLRGLMNIWNGDTAARMGNPDLALTFYEAVLNDDPEMIVDDLRVGAIAMKQIARTWLAIGNPEASASWERALLAQYGGEMNREASLARILILEAMVSGTLPLSNPSEILHHSDCSAENPCLIASSDSVADMLPMQLNHLDGFQFVLSPRDLALLVQDTRPKGEGSRSRKTVACVVSAASNGFQVPMANDHPGYEFMDNISQGYHPGLDINGPGSTNADCDTVFYSVARGCVRDSSPSNWGSAVVEHYYIPDPWYSQYGHAQTIDYSVGAAIFKGSSLGTVGRVGTSTCHLHHEIRESDHPDPQNADYYSGLTWTNVGDRYQDPSPFVNAHRSYQWVKWVDEGAFTTTGTWTGISGTGDRDDLKWATTTPANTKTQYANYTFTPTNSGNHELWVFVPYNYATSTGAKYKLTRNGATKVLETTIDQSIYSDAWVYAGSAYLLGGVAHELEVATNTGESDRKVAIDDFLIIRP